jgi:hypothetical protein
VQGGLRCREAEREAAAGRAILHYRRAGWPTSTCIGELAGALYFGPTPAPAAVARCEQLLDHEADDRTAEANVLVFQGGLTAMLGQFDDARALVERARATYEELGQVQLAATYGSAVAAGVDLLAGDVGASTERLRALYDVYERLDDHAHLATCAAELADATYRVGSYDESRELTRVAERSARADDVGAQVAWRSVRSKLLARAGAFAEATRIRDSALGLSEATDTLNQRAKVQLDAAEVAALTGDDTEAAAFGNRAIQLYELKGNVVAAARARAMTDEGVPA